MTDTEIRVGEYVRFRDGNIRKVIKRNVDNEIVLDRLWRYGCGVTWVTKTEEKEDIINHDFNIIKLIKVGDYVNGIRVDAKTEGFITFFDGDGDIYLFASDIKSIVTKEQFKSMEYKVGGEDEQMQ